MRDVPRAAGSQLARYERLRPIGSGGMAEIMLARTRDTQRLVVLKQLHAHLAHDPNYVQMFHDEAVIASKLHHPNLVEVFELGTDGEQHYLAMEYLHGHDLNRVLRRMMKDRVPLLFQHAIAIVRDVAAGLHHAHERIDDQGKLLEIIHRDISPHNVFLTFLGEVKVVDFGIAKASTRVGQTRTGVLKGKAAYMSPEQALGEPLDRRSDVFAMGIVLWELTAGRWLFRRKSELEMMKAVVETDAPRPSTVRPDYPRDLERIVMKALARSPEQRWATAGELRAALDELARRWQFVPSRTLIAKLMRTVFTDEVTAWETARQHGASLADHVLAVPPAAAAKAERAPEDNADNADDGATLETRRGPPEPEEAANQARGWRPWLWRPRWARQTPSENQVREWRPWLWRPRSARGTPSEGRAREWRPWRWPRHRIVVALIAVAAVVAIAGVIALLVPGDRAPGAPVAAPQRTPDAAWRVPGETLDLPARAAAPPIDSSPPSQRAAAPPVESSPPTPRVAPPPQDDAPVPIVFPPADPTPPPARRRVRAKPAAHAPDPATGVGSGSSTTPNEPALPIDAAEPAPPSP